MTGTDDFARQVRRLVDQVSHWTPPRWAASAASGDGTRADAVYALVQDLADLTADLEGEPRRTVPRLDSDTALPDQLRVIAADLSTALTEPAPADLAAATRAAATARATATLRLLR